MTILLRLYPDTQRIDPDELEQFMTWLRALGINPFDVRAAAIEAPAVELPDEFYLLHLAEFIRDSGGGVKVDPATDKPAFAYRTIRIDGWTWPTVRAQARERVR